MQLKIQQDKKEEIDRLKTQYTFKVYISHFLFNEVQLIFVRLSSNMS